MYLSSHDGFSWRWRPGVLPLCAVLLFLPLPTFPVSTTPFVIKSFANRLASCWTDVHAWANLNGCQTPFSSTVSNLMLASIIEPTEVCHAQNKLNVLCKL